MLKCNHGTHPFDSIARDSHTRIMHGAWSILKRELRGNAICRANRTRFFKVI